MPTPPTAFEYAYQKQLASGKTPDPAQAAAVAALGRLSRELTQSTHWWRKTRPQGVYLYGPVGRGKTWLMNLFYRTLPIDRKLRYHFHAFMREEVHGPLKRLRRHDDPLPRLAHALARRTQVLCFDELLVEDIADAMLLGPLLQALFTEGVALVATANLAPDALYHNGLKHENFLPAIHAIETHCAIVAVDGAHDYRADYIDYDGMWQVTPAATGTTRLATLFAQLCDVGARPLTLTLNERRIDARGASENTVFFDFSPLCVEARNADDYIELAEHYRTVMVNAIPRLDDEMPGATRRFIALIDVLYERHTLLIATAAAEPEALYTDKRFHYEFKRTISRLEEMRSTAWLAGTHLARVPTLTPL